MPGSISKTVSPILTRLCAGFLVVLALAAVLAATPSRNACATTLQTACDPEFMDAVQARGYMEAQRQIEQNGNLIFKQDSVLEYTCFDQWMGHVSFDPAWGFYQPFTDTGFSGSEMTFYIFNQSGNALYGSLSMVVWTALNKYIVNNYGDRTQPHRYLDGRGATPTWDYTAPMVQGNYNCRDMENVWQTAHCMNFLDEPDHDSFFDFYWYAIQDARSVDYSRNWLAAGPRNMCQGGLYTGSLPPNAGLVFNDTNDIEVAFNNNGRKFGGLYYGGVGPNENNWSKPPTSMTDVVIYQRDPLLTRFDLMLVPGSGAPAPANCNNVLPIPTGICVIRSELSDVYQDAWCPNPACHYEFPTPPVNRTPGADPANCNAAQLGRCRP